LRDKITKKLKEIASYPKQDAPRKHGDHYYLSYNSGEEDHKAIYKIKRPNTYKFESEDDIQSFLDASELPDGTASITEVAWSPDNRYAAYMVQSRGSDWATARVRDVETMADLEEDVLKGLKFSYLQWTPDSLGFFYGAWDSFKNFDGHETKKLAFNKVYYHLVGTSDKEDKLIYENPK